MSEDVHARFCERPRGQFLRSTHPLFCFHYRSDALKFLIAGEEITVREGEVLHIPSWVEHQAEALDDTFELDLFSPIRQDWLDHTDTYFHRSTRDE